jgi:lipoate-protein ligase A
MSNALIVESKSHDPWHNLALEEYIMHNMPDNNSIALYLWQNQNTVVIGRNQNAWAECKTGLLEEEGGRLARRTTGGGAVFHDLGNLNFSIVLPENIFDLENSFEVVLSAVRETGINAERSGRNDILFQGAKFSGNAFRKDKGFGLHHGTLLVNSEYERVARYLTVSPSKLAAKGIQSVRSRIVNLQSINPNVSTSVLKAAMETAFINHFCGLSEASSNGMQIIRLTDQDYVKDDSFNQIEKKFASWEWRYGQSIKFDAEIEQRFDWGMVKLGLVVKQGIIESAELYSDALDSDLISSLPECMVGVRFISADLAAALHNFEFTKGGYGVPRQKMINDLSDLIADQNW